MRTRFEENASPDIAQAAAENYIVLVPLGCVEQHGPHLPVNADWNVESIVAAAERARERHGAKSLVLPLLPFGTAAEHTAFAGTISLSFGTWSALVVEVIRNLLRDGFRRIVVVKGCGGHIGIEGPVYELYCEAKRRLPDLDIRVFGGQGWAAIAEVVADTAVAHPSEYHAGGVETSMVLARSPELVHLDRLEKPGRAKAPWHGCWWIAEDLSDTGATGDPTRYDAELGRRIIERQTEILCDFLGEMWAAGGEGAEH